MKLAICSYINSVVIYIYWLKFTGKNIYNIICSQEFNYLLHEVVFQTHKHIWSTEESMIIRANRCSMMVTDVLTYPNVVGIGQSQSPALSKLRRLDTCETCSNIVWLLLVKLIFHRWSRRESPWVRRWMRNRCWDKPWSWTCPSRAACSRCSSSCASAGYHSHRQ